MSARAGARVVFGRDGGFRRRLGSFSWVQTIRSSSGRQAGSSPEVFQRFPPPCAGVIPLSHIPPLILILASGFWFLTETFHLRSPSRSLRLGGEYLRQGITWGATLSRARLRCALHFRSTIPDLQSLLGELGVLAVNLSGRGGRCGQDAHAP